MNKKIKAKLQDKRLISLIIILVFAVVGALVLVFSFAATPVTASLSLSSSSLSYDVGSTLSVDINETSTEGVASVQADLTYDASKLSLVSVTPTAIDFDACVKKPVSGGGNVYLACASTNGPQTGLHKVATVTFTVLATGSAAPVNTTINFASTALVKRADLSVAWSGPATGGTYSLVTPDKTAPVLSPITMSPSVNPVSGFVTFSGTASDPGSSVAKMELYVNGVLKSTMANVGSISYTWDSNTIADNTTTGYPVTIKAYDNGSPQNIATSDIFVVKVLNSKPDLAVTNIILTPINPATTIPVKNGTVKVSAVIKNVGSAPTIAGIVDTIGFTVDGVSIGTATDSAALAVGASRTIDLTAQWTATTGSHVIAANVDVNNLIAESGLATNNIFTLPAITVYKLGDASKDTIVGLDDLTLLATNWNKANATYFEGNLNNDTTINIDDLTILANNWGL